MSADSENCRKVWAALEKYPALQVKNVIVDSMTYRWACLVRVPWDRYAVAVDSIESVGKLSDRLEKWEAEERAELLKAEQRAAAEAPTKIEPKAADVVLAETVVAVHKSGEMQLGLF